MSHLSSTTRFALTVAAVVLGGCAPAHAANKTAAAAGMAASTRSAQPIDPTRIGTLTGAKPEVSGSTAWNRPGQGT